MSAPVRLEGTFLGHQLSLKCDHCGLGTAVVVGESDVMIDRLKKHETTCPAIQLARLQARWDARDEALRGLVTQWRQRADEAAASSDGDDDAAAYYHRYACASELERAIEGGK